jgi:Zn-dependent protease with chaperone function
MTTPDNKNLFDDIIADIKEYIELKGQLAYLNFQEKLSAIASSITLFLIVTILIVLVFAFGSIGLALLISKYFNQLYAGFFIMALFYLIVLLLLWFNAKKWVKNPVTNFLIKNINRSASDEI